MRRTRQNAQLKAVPYTGPSALTELRITSGASIREAMAIMDKNGRGIVFILNSEEKLLGIATNGDVRRALLSGASLRDSIDGCMKQKFVFATESMAKSQKLSLLSQRITCLPVLDDSGRVVEVYHWTDYRHLPISTPLFEGNEGRYLFDCLGSGWISSSGPFIDRFEGMFRNYLPQEFALCTSNGTTALHLAFLALGVGQGDEVIVPNFTFISPASVAVHCGATPVFVDVDPMTWTIDVSKIEARITPKTKVIVAVHLYGHPCDMDPILAIAQKHGLTVVEDCAEALGAEYKGRKVGTLGDIGTFSFFANKVITTGEGGMVVTKSAKLYDQMSLLRNHGMRPSRKYWHEMAGFNFRMTNLQASIGVAQMESIDTFISARRKAAQLYIDRFSRIAGVLLPTEKPWAKNIYWLFSIVLKDELGHIARDTLIEKLASADIDARPFFSPMHVQPAFQGMTSGSFPVTDQLAARGLSLPTSSDLTEKEIDRVFLAVKDAIRPSTKQSAPRKIVGNRG